MSQPSFSDESNLQPIQPGERSVFLDVLRGVAMLGILPVNIAFFALPLLMAEARPLASEALSEHWAYHGVELLMEQKFITTFALLFGVGLFLIQSRGSERGSAPQELVVTRLLVLWVFGVLHAVLLWYGDILVLYAPLGLTVFWAWNKRPARLLALGCALLFVSFLTLPIGLALGFGEASEVALSDLREWNPAGPVVWNDILQTHFDMRVFGGGSFLEVCVARGSYSLLGGLFALVFYGPRLLGLMLIGMAWAQQGWFVSPQIHPAPFRRLLIWGLGLGVPLSGLGTWLSTRGFDLGAELAHYAGSLGGAAAIAGVCAWIVTACERHWWVQALRAVGRTAFSNYIFQSVVASTVFCSYGFGWFGQLTRVELLLVVVVIWIAELVLSVVWLDWFRMGPIEWLWRRLSLGALRAVRGA